MSSRRRRLIRYVLTGLVVLLLAGYGAFTTFFFNPFESDYEFDLATLVPRDVDFFLSKAGLGDDFDPFPVPAFADELQASRVGGVLERTPWYVEQLEALKVEEAVRSLQDALAQSPVEVSPLQLVGGEDLALAGYFDGAALEDARWALIGRMGWIGKFAVELLDRPSWIGLEAQGITAEPLRATIQSSERQIGVTLSGGQLTRPLTVGRVHDVVVVTTDATLATEFARLGSVRGENSFGLSAKFADRIDVASRSGEELEVFVDAVKLSAAMGWQGKWPDRGADTFLPAFLGRLFQVGFVNELAGRIEIDRGVAVNLEGQLSSELLGDVQRRLYRQPHFDKHELQSVARLAPGDVGLFAYLRGDVSDLLDEALAALDQATVELLEGKVREVWGHQSPGPLIGDIEAALQGRAAFFARANDYPPTALDPPNDGAVVPAWAFAVRVQDNEQLQELVVQINSRPQAFGLEPIPGAEGNGIYTINTSSGSKITEYISPHVPGTGEIATLDVRLSRSHYYVVSNSRPLLDEIDQVYFNIGGAAARSLLAQPEFEAFVNAGLPSASAMAWINPRAMSEHLRKAVDETVRIDARSRIEWDRIRPQVERDVLREEFGGASEDSLAQADRDRFLLEVGTRLDVIEREAVAENAPVLARQRKDAIALWEGIRAGLFQLALDPKQVAFHARLTIPLEPPEAGLDS